MLNDAPTRLRVWRLRNGLTVELMSSLLGLSEADYDALENRRYSLTPADVLALQITFGENVRVETLLKRVSCNDADDAVFDAMDAYFEQIMKKWGNMHRFGKRSR